MINDDHWVKAIVTMIVDVAHAILFDVSLL